MTKIRGVTTDLLQLKMNLVSKLLIYLCILYLFNSQSALAGKLSDRIERFPNWDGAAQVTRHDGELAYPEWFRGQWVATS